MVEVQKGKKKDLNKGLGISKEDYSRACANNYVIDTDKRKRPFEEPKMTE